MADQDDQNTGMQDDAGRIDAGTDVTDTTTDDTSVVADDVGGEIDTPDADDASTSEGDDASTPQTDDDADADGEAQPS